MTQYGTEGFMADLPELITSRYGHACAGYYDDKDQLVLLVAGGFNLNMNEDPSTEIFTVRVDGVSSRWIEVSPPFDYRPDLASATTFNNQIYLTG